MKENKKIVPFDIMRMDPEDLETDRFLRESVKEEADELEKRLNSDPSLIGVGASDDLFDAIVGKLKEQGLWEEEENETAESETSDVKQEEKAVENAPEKESLPRSDVEYSQEQRVSGVDRVEKCTENGSDCGKTSGSEQISDSGKAEEGHRILSEEEETLLELGRQTMKQKEKRAMRRKKWGHVLKRCGAVASVFVVIGGIGMTSEANRKVVMKAWDAVMENFRFRIATDHVEEGTSLYSELFGAEKEAFEDIREKLGIQILFFLYKPEEMKFLEYEINTEDSHAVMIYTNQDKIFTVDMLSNQAEYNNYYSADSEKQLVDSYELMGAKVGIWHQSADIESEAYLAEIKRDESRYIINGIMPIGELKKMIEYSVFL